MSECPGRSLAPAVESPSASAGRMNALACQRGCPPTRALVACDEVFRGAPQVAYRVDLIILRKSSSRGAPEDADVTPGMSIQPALVSMIPGAIRGTGLAKEWGIFL